MRTEPPEEGPRAAVMVVVVVGPGRREVRTFLECGLEALRTGAAAAKAGVCGIGCGGDDARPGGGVGRGRADRGEMYSGCVRIKVEGEMWRMLVSGDS